MSEDLVLTLDHLVLTVADVERSVAFYLQHLGMRPVTFGDNQGERITYLHNKPCEQAMH